MKKEHGLNRKWFDMQGERRKLIKELPAEMAQNILLAWFDFLEAGEIPQMPAMDKIAFTAIFQDLEESWYSYELRNEFYGERRRY